MGTIHKNLKTQALDKVQSKVEAFVVWLNEQYGDITGEVFQLERLKTQFRVTKTISGSKSVYCFVDSYGDVFKPASYKVAAKHPRGNVSNLNTHDFQQHSPRYL